VCVKLIDEGIKRGLKRVRPQQRNYVGGF